MWAPALQARVGRRSPRRGLGISNKWGGEGEPADRKRAIMFEATRRGVHRSPRAPGSRRGGPTAKGVHVREEDTQGQASGQTTAEQSPSSGAETEASVVPRRPGARSLHATARLVSRARKLSPRRPEPPAGTEASPLPKATPAQIRACFPSYQRQYSATAHTERVAPGARLLEWRRLDLSHRVTDLAERALPRTRRAIRESPRAQGVPVVPRQSPSPSLPRSRSPRPTTAASSVAFGRSLTPQPEADTRSLSARVREEPVHTVMTGRRATAMEEAARPFAATPLPARVLALRRAQGLLVQHYSAVHAAVRDAFEGERQPGSARGSRVWRGDSEQEDMTIAAMVQTLRRVPAFCTADFGDAEAQALFHALQRRQGQECVPHGSLVVEATSCAEAVARRLQAEDTRLAANVDDPVRQCGHTPAALIQEEARRPQHVATLARAGRAQSRRNAHQVTLAGEEAVPASPAEGRAAPPGWGQEDEGERTVRLPPAVAAAQGMADPAKGGNVFAHPPPPVLPQRWVAHPAAAAVVPRLQQGRVRYGPVPPLPLDRLAQRADPGPMSTAEASLYPTSARGPRGDGEEGGEGPVSARAPARPATRWPDPGVVTDCPAPSPRAARAVVSARTHARVPEWRDTGLCRGAPYSARGAATDPNAGPVLLLTARGREGEEDGGHAAIDRTNVRTSYGEARALAEQAASQAEKAACGRHPAAAAAPSHDKSVAREDKEAESARWCRVASRKKHAEERSEEIVTKQEQEIAHNEQRRISMRAGGRGLPKRTGRRRLWLHTAEAPTKPYPKADEWGTEYT